MITIKSSLKKIYKALSGEESSAKTVVGIIDDITEYFNNRS